MDANFLQEADRKQAVPLSMKGRYMLHGSNEDHECDAYEMSTDAVSLVAPVIASPGTEVVLYLADLGRFAGRISRPTDRGFEMRLHLTPKKREKLAGQLAWYAGRATMSADEKRRHERIVPLTDLTILRLPQGEEHVAHIRSLSLSGVAIQTDHYIPLGAQIIVGHTPARVVRVEDDGIACEFLRHFEPEEIDETTRL